MFFRMAELDDMREIAKVNLKCVPEGNRQNWGLDLVSSYFGYYYREMPWFIVVEHKKNIIGYVMGYRKESTAREKFFLNEGEKICVKQDGLQNKKKTPEKDYDAVLYSLCVLPEYKDHGIGTELAKRYRNFLYEKYHIFSCCVETQIGNGAARKMYEKAGYKYLYENKNVVWYGWKRKGETK